MELYRYVPTENREEVLRRFKDSKFTLEEAKAKFPKWYEKVVVQGNKTRTKWDIKGHTHGSNPYALYDWWKRMIREGATYHHRYFAVMALVVYGVKCDVPEEKVRADAEELMPFLTDINKDNPFTRADIASAMDCYDDRYATFPARDISKLTGIPIPQRKRNGRPQVLHLAGARAIQKINDEFNGTSWREGNGRPDKQGIVLAWRAAHPDGRKADCVRDTGLSKPTVYKWWK